MKLKCKINGTIYDIVQGATFSDEYNETLDSGNIVISDVAKIEDLMPYDRVEIWDLDSAFKKRMLIDGYSEEMMIIDGSLYKYKITLFSEIKALEKVVCPNISITQPLEKEKKRSVYFYLQKFVDAYSPKYKRALTTTWTHFTRYTLDPSLEAIFGSVFAPETTMTNPSLRDVLAQLMITKDCIPYVENYVIKALDISKRNGAFQINPSKHSFVFGSMSSGNYATGLRREYSGAISQHNSAQMVEYLGFRNPGGSLLTFGNLQLETRFPIYKINKLIMCYYKKYRVADNSERGYYEKMFLCEQDITPLILQSTVRNTLPKDWKDFNENSGTDPDTNDGNIDTVEELAQYRLGTLGYTIGSNIIAGWGEEYKYPTIAWWSKTKTYIQNIVEFMDSRYQFGTNHQNNFGYVMQEGEFVFVQGNWLNNSIMNPYHQSAKFKGLFFKMEYNAMYNGATIISKDRATRDDLVTNDNSSAALSILETDGLFQKEKVNRLGNKTITITARFDSYADMVAHNNILGAVYGDDIVIYHRDISIYENAVDATFIGCYDYVLKNYFTSVWARLRTYNLMPYSESVKRAEVEKRYLLLSQEEAYYEADNLFENRGDFIKLFSAFVPTEVLGNEKFDRSNKINGGYFTYAHDGGRVVYCSDLNSFVVGNSLCFNIKTYDNVSGGVYISSVNYDVDEKDPGDYRGSMQDWLLTVADREDPFTENIGCYIATMKNTELVTDAVPWNETQVEETYLNVLMWLPQASQLALDRTNRIGRSFVINKDNKETLDMTFQFEPIVYETSVAFSPWLMKLSDLLGVYNKHDKDVFIVDRNGGVSFPIKAMWYVKGGFLDYFGPGHVVLKMPNVLYDVLKVDDGVSIPTERTFLLSIGSGDYAEYTISFGKVSRVDRDAGLIDVWASFKKVSYSVGTERYTEFFPYTLLRFNLFETDDTLYKYLICIINEQLENDVFQAGTGLSILGLSDKVKRGTPPDVVVEGESAFVDDAYIKVSHDVNTADYGKNMYVLYSRKSMKKNVVYDDIDPANVPEDYTITNRSVAETFSLTTVNGIPAIDVFQGSADRIYFINSIQYWYKDIDGLLKFVFGVDTRVFPEGAHSREFYVYLSMLTRKDTRVFDQNGDAIGNIYNHAEGNDVSYGLGQFYTLK